MHKVRKELTSEQKEKIKEYNKMYRENNKEIIAEQRKEYRKTNKNKIREYNSKYLELKDNEVKEQRKKYRKNNKVDIKEYNQNYKETNKLKINKTRREYINNKTKNDKLYKNKNNIRLSILKSIKRKNYNKTNKTIKILGCSYEEFKTYLESKFEFWMTWDNYGLYNGSEQYGWDIDHRVPLSSAKTEEEVIRLNHYTNLQPLCSHINRNMKRNKLQ